jgi:hypothetical protein
MELAAGARLGPYEIAAKIGAGGMGVVYRAKDTRLGRDVAIKVLPEALQGDPDRLRRFTEEAKTTGALNHPNVVAVLDVGEHQGAPFLVAELLEGQPLRAKLGAPLSARKAAEWGANIAQGLAAAHEKGIVHRDLKPENVFVTRDGRVKILDFGIAKLVSPPSGNDSTLGEGTAPGAIVGTPGYMAPEQARGNPADQRSDLFALGAILHEMLAGPRAFRGASPLEVAYAVIHSEPADLPADVPPSFDRLVRRLLAKDPAQRFQSARDLAFHLEAIAQPTTSTTSGIALPAPAAAPARRSWTVPAAIGAALVASALTWAIASRRHRTAPTPAPVVAAPAPAPTFQRLTFGRGRITNARFEPGTDRILYSAEWDGPPSKIYEIAHNQREPRPVVEGTLLDVSASGDLVIGQPDGFALGSTSGGVALRPLGDDQVMFVAGREARLRCNAGPGCTLEYPPGHKLPDLSDTVAISPTGDAVAMLRHGVGLMRGTIVILDLDGKMLASTPEWFRAGGLVWTRDGREVWFGGAEGPQDEMKIRALGRDGRQRVILAQAADLWPLDLSADGRLLMTRFDHTFGVQLRLADGVTRDVSFPGHPLVNDVTPDGRGVVFYDDASSPPAAFVWHLGDAQPMRIGEGIAGGLAPDGKSDLVIGEDRKSLSLVPLTSGATRAIDVGDAARIDDVPVPRFLPDGEHILAAGAMKDGHAAVFELDATGKTPPRAILHGQVDPDGEIMNLNSDGKFLCSMHAHGFVLVPLDGGPVVAPKGADGFWCARIFRDGTHAEILPANLIGEPQELELLDLKTGERRPFVSTKPSFLPGFARYERYLVTDDGLVAMSYKRDFETLYLVDGLH